MDPFAEIAGCPTLYTFYLITMTVFPCAVLPES